MKSSRIEILRGNNKVHTKYPRWTISKTNNLLSRIDAAVFDSYEINIKLMLVKNEAVFTYNYN